MKKQLLSLLSMILLIGIGQNTAQERFQCTTENQELLLERITANRIYHEQNPGLLNSRMPSYIPIKFNLLADFDGSQRIRITAMLDVLCRLNEFYANYDITFYLDNNGTTDEPEYFNLLDNRGAFLNPRTSAATEYMVDNKDPGAVNLFVGDSAGMGAGATVSAGYTDLLNDFLVIPKSSIVGQSGTLEHEMGHFFTLAHPHTGWEDTGWGDADPTIYNPVYAYGTTVTVTSVSSAQGFNIPVELVDRSNCQTAGDRICDTPADYGFGPHQTTPCNWNKKVYDRNGEEVNPMVDNIMAYFNPCPEYVLTPDQVEAINADYLSPRRAHLRSSYIPQNINPVVDEVVIITPQNTATSDNYNSVEFAWEPVANATDYLVEISDPTGNIRYYETRNTAILVEDLDPNSTYLWFVHPFNEVSACTQSATFFLFTNDSTTGTKEIEGLNEFSILPNPISMGELQSLQLHIDKELDNTRVSVHSMNGAVVYNQQFNLSSGVNRLDLGNSGLQQGVYIVKVETKEGIATQKLIVN